MNGQKPPSPAPNIWRVNLAYCCPRTPCCFPQDGSPMFWDREEYMYLQALVTIYYDAKDDRLREVMINEVKRIDLPYL